MHPALNKNLFFVKEHVKMFKAANSFDIFDPETKEQILQCSEDNLGIFTRMFRFTDYKRTTPFNMHVKDMNGNVLFTIKRGVSFFLSNVQVLDSNGMLLGMFKQKLFSLGGKFEVLDASERSLCMLRGKWTSWEFKFVSNDGKEFAAVTKQWGGLGKELFTSADNYVLEINSQVPNDHPLRVLILAAVMCIDLVLKE